MIKSFNNFLKVFSSKQGINESEVELKKKLKEYTLTHLTGPLFKVESEDFQKEFSVEPYGKEILKTLPEVRSKLEEAISKKDASELYKSIKIAERVPYEYGNITDSEFNLSQVPDLMVSIPDDLKRVAVSSEREFLYNNFNELNKEQRDSLVSVLSERAELICVSIEALFYFRRLNDKTEYYNEMNWEEILDEYQAKIEESTKEANFSADGPYSNFKTKSDVKNDSLRAYWICEKDQSKFFIFCTVSPEKLHAEDTIGGISGLKFSISKDGENPKEDDFNFFPVTELTTRVKLFLKHNKKKK